MIPIKQWTRGAESIAAADGRTLHKALGVGRDFSTWINARVQGFGYLEGEDFASYLVERGAGTPAKEYLLTLNMGAELCLLERNDTGRALRRFILDRQKANVCTCGGVTCTDEKPMWELTTSDLQTDTLKACLRCHTPHKLEGPYCQTCNHFDEAQEQKAALVRQRNQTDVTDNPFVECLINREGNTTTTIPPYGTTITFVRNAKGRAVAKVERPEHRAYLLNSIFYRSYFPDQEA